MESSRRARLPEAFGSPSVKRGIRRNRSSEWHHRATAADSSSDNDDLVSGLALRPAKSGELLGPALTGSFSQQQLEAAAAAAAGGGGSYHSSSGGGGYAAVVDSVTTPDQLHYASHSVSLGGPAYQSLGRRRSRAKPGGPGRQLTSLSSSDNNSDVYGDTEGHSKLEALQNGMHSPPEPAPPEGPSKTRMVQLGRSLQRGQTGKHQYSIAETSNGLSSVTDYRLPGGTRGQLVDTGLRGFNSPSELGSMPNSRLVLDFGAKDGVGSGGGVGGPGSVRPLVMPVYPTRATVCSSTGAHPPPAYSPQQQLQLGATMKQQLDSCWSRPWQMAAMALAAVALLLLALVIYLSAVPCSCQRVEGSRCVMVEDALAMKPDSHQTQPQPAHSQTNSDKETVLGTICPPLVVPEATAAPPTVPPAPTISAPASLNWADTLTSKLEPDSSWLLSRKLSESQIVNLTLTVSVSGRLAVMGCRNVHPSLVQHEFISYIRDGTLHSQAESVSIEHSRHLSDEKVAITLSQFMETGDWWIAVYNGNDQPIRANMMAVSAKVGVPTCAGDCSGHGTCHRGHCVCHAAYSGDDCATSVCPVLCSGHGRMVDGLCHCDSAWHGAQCEVPAQQCVVADCHDHGSCSGGKCTCSKGWTGEHCQIADCIDRWCSGHGVCVEGECVCRTGWLGRQCESVDPRLHACLPNCSGHGRYDLTRDKCECHDEWTGDNCDTALCSLDCGEHGLCAGGRCQCHAGWTGERCQARSCDSRCDQHGRCRDGQCVCARGYNGKHCTLDGCGDECSQHGTCVQSEVGWYSCRCHRGWAGTNCSLPVELNCQDGLDNDNDGMTDCSDSECCWGDASCRGSSLMCLYSPEPVDVLLQKQPPLQTASFYQRIKFLIDEGSVQDYAEKDEYWERRVSVIRGRVVTSRGLGIVGVRVSVNRDTRFGLTLSRKDGWFDMMVNGGGAVNLQFQRAPFSARTLAVSVSWNRMVVLEPTVMLLEREDATSQPHQLPRPLAAASCGLKLLQHQLRPVVVSTWQPALEGGSCCSEADSCIIPESQSVQESIEVPGTGLKLVYNSQDASGYHSVLMIRLTPASVPPSLALVHLRVVVEGNVQERTYEADANLTHVFDWNKRNVYQQKVYGVVEAKVTVGYEFQQCPHIVWETVVTDIPAFRMDISQIGGWNLDIHHTYNFNEGILQKGSGEVTHFRRQGRVVTPLMGTGHQRTLHCDKTACSGHANRSSLLKPVAMATAADGSVYVGDFNMIRRVTTSGDVYTVVELRSSQVSYGYHMAISPVDQLLYVSDPETLQVFKTRRVDQVPDPKDNLVRVAGTGVKCVPGDLDRCGDSKPALHAKLTHPKGLSVSPEEEVFLADGTNLRYIDAYGIIYTLLGNHNHLSTWTPMPCYGALNYDEVQPQWPTQVALSPVDGSVYYIDDRLLLQLSPDGAVRVRLGRPSHCPTNQPVDSDDPLQPRVAIDALQVDTSGQVFVAVTDNGGLQRLLQLSPEGSTQQLATSCLCTRQQLQSNQSCSCSDQLAVGDKDRQQRQLPASELQMSAVTALAVGADGTLHVADGGALRVYSLRHNLPQSEPGFKVLDPVRRTVYSFNRYGQHVETKDLLTGRSIYLFQYTKNNGFGRLDKITDWSGNIVKFSRDYSNIVTSIENWQGESYSVYHMSRGGLVTNLTTPSNKHRLDYHLSTELLTSHVDTRGRVHIYQYDSVGRLSTAVTSSGESVKLDYQMNSDDAIEITIQKRNASVETIRIDQKRSSVHFSNGDMQSEIRSFPNQSLLLHQPGYMDTLVQYSSLPQLSPLYSRPLQILPSGISQKQTVARHSTYPSLSGQYSLLISPLVDSPIQRMLVTKTLTLNGSALISLEYDAVSLQQRYNIWPSIGPGTVAGTTSVKNYRKVAMTVQFSESVLPSSWLPSGLEPMHVLYDSAGRVKERRWNQLRLQLAYGRSGVIKRTLAASSPQQSIDQQYTYDPNHQPATFTLEGGQRQYEYHYDSSGGLQFIVTPSRSRHFFVTFPTVGAVQVQYTPPLPGGATSHSQDIDGSSGGDSGGGGEERGDPVWAWRYGSDGRLLAEWRPANTGRSVYRYDSAGRLTEEVQGDGHTLIEYVDSAGTALHTSSAHIKDTPAAGARKPFRIRREQTDGFSVTSLLTWQGPVLRQWRQSFGAKWSGLAPVLLRYDYSQQLQLVGIEGRIGSRQLPPLQLVNSAGTGRLGPFRVWRTTANHTVFFDGAVRLERTRDSYLRPAGLALSVNGYQVFRRQLEYDRLGRLVAEHSWRSGAARVTRQLGYGTDGQLTSDRGEAHWSFQHDVNANLVQISVKNSNITLKVDSADRTVRLGSGVLHYDYAGALVENFRGDRYQYDSRGLLVAVNGGRRRFQVNYHYDQWRRLVARRNNNGNVTQFVYADLRHPLRPTHFLHSTAAATGAADTLTSVLYDDQGHVIRVDIDTESYTVVTDWCGSPQLLFARDGRLVRELSRSAYGHRFADSWPHMALVLDYCGGIYDADTELVHLATLPGRVYDPLLGQLLAPDVDQFRRHLMQPQRLHLYRLNGNRPLSLLTEEILPVDDADWMKRLGHSIESLFPQQLDQQPLQLYSSCAQPAADAALFSEQLTVSSAARCRLGQMSLTADLLQLISPVSAMTVQRRQPPNSGRRRFSSRPGPLGPGAVLEPSASGLVRVWPVPSVDPIAADVLTTVFNGSHLLNMTGQHQGHTVLHICQPDLWRFAADLQQLTRLGHYNVTSQSHDPAGGSASQRTTSLRLVTGGGGSGGAGGGGGGGDWLIHVRYGARPEHEYQRVARHQQRLAVRAAWWRERQLLRRGFSNYRWSASQRKTLLRQEPRQRTLSVDTALRYPAHLYPELSDDPFNVRFGRR